MKDRLQQLRPAVVLFALLTMLTGGVYPVLVTLLAQSFFPRQANGSLLTRNGRAVGSELIGQPFDDPGYFWGRPSATGTFPYNAFDATYLTGSAGSNYGPLDPALLEAVRSRIAALRSADPGSAAPIPVDLVTASASGLDPDISPAAAYYQVPRVARARGLPSEELMRLVEDHIEGRQWGILGEPRVNVLKLNLALDEIN
jgi:K+-transporting ATPase ATPase C chain